MNIQYTHLVQIIGGLFLLDLMACLPFFPQAFQCDNTTNATVLKLKHILIGLSWIAGSFLLISGRQIFFLLGALLLWIIFRQEFIQKRWLTIHRGFGAPGFMSHFTVQYLLLFELIRCLDQTGQLKAISMMVFRIDFGIVMICAGTYKGLVGFYKNEGMEYGIVNPFWGYFWNTLRHYPTNWWYFRLNNIAASSIEIIAGILLLIPSSQVVGAILVTISFLYVGLLVRLGRLAVLMATLPLFCLPSVIKSYTNAIPALILTTPYWLIVTTKIILIAYVVLLPIVKLTQYYNLFLDKQLPQPWQKWISAYSNFIPIIIWRVFTPDLTNFFIRIRASTSSKDKIVVLLDEHVYHLNSKLNWSLKLRFWHVAESIALVSIFTLKKYYPSRPELFQNRILQYAKSLKTNMDLMWFEFTYVEIRKYDGNFIFKDIKRFIVDTTNNNIIEEDLTTNDTTSMVALFSPVRESEAPGKYTKLLSRNS